MYCVTLIFYSSYPNVLIHSNIYSYALSLILFAVLQIKTISIRIILNAILQLKHNAYCNISYQNNTHCNTLEGYNALQYYWTYRWLSYNFVKKALYTVRHVSSCVIFVPIIIGLFYTYESRKILLICNMRRYQSR